LSILVERVVMFSLTSTVSPMRAALIWALVVFLFSLSARAEDRYYCIRCGWGVKRGGRFSTFLEHVRGNHDVDVNKGRGKLGEENFCYCNQCKGAPGDNFCSCDEGPRSRGVPTRPFWRPGVGAPTPGVGTTRLHGKRLRSPGAMLHHLEKIYGVRGSAWDVSCRFPTPRPPPATRSELFTPFQPSIDFP